MQSGGKSSNYKIVDTNPDYQKDLELLPPDAKQALKGILDRLQNDPFDPSLRAKQIEGDPNVYYIKFPDDKEFRLIYRVEINSHKIYMRQAEKRGSATYHEYRKNRYLGR